MLFFRNFFPIPELIFGITSSFSSFGGRTFLFFVGLYTTAAIFSIQAWLFFVLSFSMVSPLSVFLLRRIQRYFVIRILLNNLLRIKIIYLDNIARHYYIPCPVQRGQKPIPCAAAHPRIGHPIRKYTASELTGQILLRSVKRYVLLLVTKRILGAHLKRQVVWTGSRKYTNNQKVKFYHQIAVKTKKAYKCP